MLDEIWNKPCCNNKEIHLFLGEPVQHITYTFNFICEVLSEYKHTPQEVTDLQLCKTRFREIMIHLETTRAKFENFTKTYKTIQDVSHWPKHFDHQNFITPTRSYVMDSLVFDGRQRKFVMFLFSDVLLLVKPQKSEKYSKMFRFVDILSLADITVRGDEVSDKSRSSHYKVEVQKSKKKSKIYQFFIKDREEQQRLIDQIINYKIILISSH